MNSVCLGVRYIMLFNLEEKRMASVVNVVAKYIVEHYGNDATKVLCHIPSDAMITLDDSGEITSYEWEDEYRAYSFPWFIDLVERHDPSISGWCSKQQLRIELRRLNKEIKVQW